MRLLGVTLEMGLIKEGDLEGVPGDVKLVKAGGVLGGVRGGGGRDEGGVRREGAGPNGLKGLEGH